MSLRKTFADIRRDHEYLPCSASTAARSRFWAACSCGWSSKDTRRELREDLHAEHVDDVRVAYLRDAPLERVRAIGERLKSQEGQRVANWNAVLGQEILSALEAR